MSNAENCAIYIYTYILCILSKNKEVLSNKGALFIVIFLFILAQIYIWAKFPFPDDSKLKHI